MVNDFNGKTLPDVLEQIIDPDNRGKVRCFNISNNSIPDMDALRNLLLHLTDKHKNSLYSLTFKNQMFTDEMLKYIFDVSPNFTILHNILIDTPHVTFSRDTLTYCEQKVINNGPYCCIVYDTNGKHNYDYYTINSTQAISASGIGCRELILNGTC